MAGITPDPRETRPALAQALSSTVPWDPRDESHVVGSRHSEDSVTWIYVASPAHLRDVGSWREIYVVHTGPTGPNLPKFYFKMFFGSVFRCKGGQFSVGRYLLVMNGVKWGNGQKSMDIHHHLFESHFAS